MKVIERTTEFSSDTVQVGDVIRIEGNTYDYCLLATDEDSDYVLISLGNGEIVGKSGSLNLLLDFIDGLHPVVVNAELSIN